MRHDVHSIDDYFAAAGSREQDLRRMDATVTANTPDMERVFTDWGPTGTGLGYGVIDYKPRSAKVATRIPVLGLVPQKRHLSLYACAVIDGQYIAERYRDQLGGVDCGKSCIRFTRYDAINEDGLVALLREVNERYAAGQVLYG